MIWSSITEARVMRMDELSRERLEVIEEYVFSGARRYKLRDKKTGVVISVSASSTEEAVEKAREILARIVKS
jgi:hypothetical protein